MAGTIGFPVIRVSLEKDPVSRQVLLEAKRSQSRYALRRRPHAPRVGQTILQVSGLEQMTRQDGHAVEQALRGRVRFREVELNGVLIDLARADRLSSDHELIALGRSHLLVQVYPEREQHIVGVEWVAVGEAEAAPQRQRIPAAVGRDRPRFGERTFGLLCLTIDVDQIGHHASNHRP